jgi:DNA-binding transcriptional regulator WhiA
MNKKIAEITITLYQQGLIARCKELEMESMCVDGNALMDFINEVQEFTDPDVRYKLTEKGKKAVELQAKYPDLTLEEIDELIEKDK